MPRRIEVIVGTRQARIERPTTFRLFPVDLAIIVVVVAFEHDFSAAVHANAVDQGVLAGGEIGVQGQQVFRPVQRWRADLLPSLSPKRYSWRPVSCNYSGHVPCHWPQARREQEVRIPHKHTATNGERSSFASGGLYNSGCPDSARVYNNGWIQLTTKSRTRLSTDWGASASRSTAPFW